LTPLFEEPQSQSHEFNASPLLSRAASQHTTDFAIITLQSVSLNTNQILSLLLLLPKLLKNKSLTLKNQTQIISPFQQRLTI
jgi:hypothetical protein